MERKILSTMKHYSNFYQVLNYSPVHLVLPMQTASSKQILLPILNSMNV